VSGVNLDYELDYEPSSWEPEVEVILSVIVSFIILRT